MPAGAGGKVGTVGDPKGAGGEAGAAGNPGSVDGTRGAVVPGGLEAAGRGFASGRTALAGKLQLGFGSNR